MGEGSYFHLVTSRHGICLLFIEDNVLALVTDAAAFPVLVWTARIAGRGTSTGSDFLVL